MFRINKCAKITDTQGCQSALSARNSSLLSLHISNNALARWLGKLIKCATHFSDAINSDFSRKQLCCAIFFYSRVFTFRPKIQSRIWDKKFVLKRPNSMK